MTREGLTSARRGSDGRIYRPGDVAPEGVRLHPIGVGRGGYPAGSVSELAFIRAMSGTRSTAETGAQWAARLAGVSAPASEPKGNDDDVLANEARALGFGKLSDARNASGETGAEMVARLGYSKKGKGR